MEGLNALIMPILNFLDQGKVRIYVSSKASLTQLQIHVNGQDAFGVTIAEWLNQSMTIPILIKHFICIGY